MKILLIEDDSKVAELIAPLLETMFHANVDVLLTVQSAVELLEGPTEPAHVVVCDYHGPSKSLLRCIAELAKATPCFFVIDDNQNLEDLLQGYSAKNVQAVDRKILSKDLIAKITALGAEGGKEIKISPEDLEKVSEHQSKLDQFLSDPAPAPTEARTAAESSLEVIQDISTKLGFTPEVRSLAKKSVELTLKLIGSKPRLSSITENLKKHEGKYITSHSLMLAEICCAIACKVGWNSATTFFKLTLAAYLHDMPIKSNELARCKTLEEAKALNPSEGLASFKLHPVRSAEFARKFNEIPPDVDTIVSQHHELPDGTGFPRGLFASQLAPLSCLFIIAEDMLHFFLENDSAGDVNQFVLARADQYQAGIFKKIMKALSVPG